MLPDGRRLGAHLPLGGEMVRTADRAIEIGATALQVFSANPSTSRRVAAPRTELQAFRGRLAAGGIAPLAIHASYLINPAAGDPVYQERSVALLASELRAARQFGAAVVNVHIGSHGGDGVAAGIGRVVTVLGRALAIEDEPEPDEGDLPEAGSAAAQVPGDGQVATDAGAALATTDPESVPIVITLENSAGGGTGIGVDLDELGAIADAIADAGLPVGRIDFCLDLAHAWSAGHDLSDPVATDAFLEAFDRRIGLDRLPLVHLNDSKSERGSRLDRHEHIGAGRIGAAGIGHLLRHPRLGHAAWILETPGMDEGYDAINVARAIALGRGETLATLPPEAFALRGERSRRAAASEPIADPA